MYSGKVIFRTPSHTKVCEILSVNDSLVTYQNNDKEKTIKLKESDCVLDGTHVALFSYFWEEHTVKGGEPEIGVTIVVIDKD